MAGNDIVKDKRKSYWCPDCETFSLYFENDLSKKCSLCDGLLKRKIAPYMNNHIVINVKGECCECGQKTNRSILGVWICKDCYTYDYDDDANNYDFVYDNVPDPPEGSINVLGEDILKCRINFNPDLLICQDCSRFVDCSIRYVLMDSPIENKNEVLPVGC